MLLTAWWSATLRPICQRRWSTIYFYLFLLTRLSCKANFSLFGDIQKILTWEIFIEDVKEGRHLRCCLPLLSSSICVASRKIQVFSQSLKCWYIVRSTIIWWSKISKIIFAVFHLLMFWYFLLSWVLFILHVIEWAKCVKFWAVTLEKCL